MDEKLGVNQGGLSLSAETLASSSLAAKRHKKLLSASHMKRKKWTEEEEETLINKYGELQRSGVLAKLKTREKKFEPIAEHVNCLHHSQDPVAFPWEWTWRDVSTKVQNMRHQYLGVKQKIRKNADHIAGADQEEEYNWDEGVDHWINFLKYKDVFGDVELDPIEADTKTNGHLKSGSTKCRTLSGSGIKNQHFRDGVSGIFEGDTDSIFVSGPYADGNRTQEAEDGSGLPGFGFGGLEYEGDDDCEAETGEDEGEKEDGNSLVERERKRRKKTDRGFIHQAQLLGLLGAQFAEIRRLEMRREERERLKEIELEELMLRMEEKEREREKEKEERQRKREERERTREKEREEMERAREERKWEKELKEQEMREEERGRWRSLIEKREVREWEWMERMMHLQLEHQSQMMHLQAQLAQGQQQISALLVSVIAQLSGQGNDIAGQGVPLNASVAQILNNAQQPVDNLVPGDDRRGVSNGSQFIVED
eukprot:TRINITY_DN7245_c0_g2_i1.p1 TRINITY_DN7245_c0_g2~~TRINITY_DN7245_c0_g2_i1.p1  ORF type:complete len:483 (-),score=142.47 TRINITY_DN7245_c0_g2_i1:122-1570(-)